ncbi:Activator of 90 kDa heat shock protein ATPase-like protein 1 [Heterocephalus glaber]|uniref:Activator of 90 kDa heat shock protein ATPase-like protein 1 n=1 Tax=Heterocephalus glaber TaxID=10181 RepID=G5AXM4_HETGA|nr:Activator of 90 kDa heat shock protein ATPase-like protein 1 [Heterocephalus glaber]
MEKLKTLFLAVQVQNEEGKCEVTEVSKLDGEASINNRKGKLIFFYEWSIKLNWTGTSKSGVQYKGHVEIPNLSDITFTFIDKNGETELCMEGRGIPAPEEEQTWQGWERYYFEGIKQTFGYGACLF